MKIKNITLHNFRQYNDISIDFPDTEKGTDLNYILAENGIGKTTLLNAITWCLYNEEKHTVKTLENQALPILSIITMKNMKIGDTAESFVSLTLVCEFEEITFKRFINSRKAEENVACIQNGGQNIVINTKGQNSKFIDSEEDFNIEVNKRLPERIQQFFFFDGEQLDNYLEGKSGKDVEKAVLGISQIDLLTLMSTRLENISTEMRRELSNKSPLTEQLNKDYEKLQQEFNDLNKQIDVLAEEDQKTKSEIISLTIKLKNEPNISELEESRELYKKHKLEIENQLEETKKNIRRLLATYTMLLTALPKLREFYDLIKEKESKDELPPRLDQEFLEDILKSNHCKVCNRDLDESSINSIKNLIHRFDISRDTGLILTSSMSSLNEALRKAANYKSEINYLWSNKETYAAQLQTLEDDIEKLDLQIRNSSNSEQNKKDHERLKKYEELDPIQSEKLSSLKAESLVLKEKIQDAKIKLEKALETKEVQTKLRKCFTLSLKAKDKVDTIIQSIKDETRSKISNEMSKIFFELMWKTDFKKVELREDYKTSITNSDNFECLGSCSAAERELLVLAFTIALHNQSGFEGPLVIDTPISRISGDLRTNFANVLKKVSENKQIILFLTKDEYTPNVRSVFESCANYKLRLSLENLKGVTKEEL